MSKLGFFPDTWMGRGVCTAGSALTDTFLMSRRQTLWPQLATAESGTWAWSGTALHIFGGNYYNSSVAQNDYIEFDNVRVESGATYKISVIGYRSTNRGIAHVSIGGVDTGARLDLYGGTGPNIIVSDTFTAGSSGTLRLSIDSKNASSSGYSFNVSQIELVKTSGGTGLGTSLDDLPWCVDVPPVSYDSTNYTPVLTQNTAQAWGGDVQITDNQNDYTEWKVWLPQGTYELKIAHKTGSDNAIGTVSLNGATIGTYNPYALSGLNNQIATISSISVASTGVHTLRITAATRDGSSTGWDLHINWLQFRKTTTTGAITATGATYGRETMELWPWFADNHTGFDTFAISSGYLHYGVFFNPTSAINQYEDWATGIKGGTYDVDLITTLYTGRGIAHLSNGGADLGTIDLYSASLTYNAARAFSSVSLDNLNPIQVSMDSKNASSSAYQNTTSFYRLTRTGA